MEEHIEYGAFVYDKEQGKYEKLFSTSASALLARNRAVEKVYELNRFMNRNFDASKVVVKKRSVYVIREEWSECNEN